MVGSYVVGFSAPLSRLVTCVVRMYFSEGQWWWAITITSYLLFSAHKVFSSFRKKRCTSLSDLASSSKHGFRWTSMRFCPNMLRLIGRTIVLPPDQKQMRCISFSWLVLRICFCCFSRIVLPPPLALFWPFVFQVVCGTTKSAMTCCNCCTLDCCVK